MPQLHTSPPSRHKRCSATPRATIHEWASTLPSIKAHLAVIMLPPGCMNHSRCHDNTTTHLEHISRMAAQQLGCHAIHVSAATHSQQASTVVSPPAQVRQLFWALSPPTTQPCSRPLIPHPTSGPPAPTPIPQHSSRIKTPSSLALLPPAVPPAPAPHASPTACAPPRAPLHGQTQPAGWPARCTAAPAAPR